MASKIDSQNSKSQKPRSQIPKPGSSPIYGPIKEHYIYFLSLTEFLNISRTANHLGLTQPQLTKDLQKLETEIGDQLFERTNRGLVLTDAGKLLRDKVLLLQQSWAEAEGGEGALPAQFKVGAHAVIANERLPMLFEGLRQEFPSVNLQYVEISSKDSSQLVANGQLDLAIAASPDRLSGLIIEEVVRDDLAIWAAAGRSKVRDSDEETLVVNPQIVQFTKLVRRSRYRSIIKVENYHLAAKVTLQLKCHALLPQPVVAPYSDLFRKVKQLDRVAIELVSAYRNRKNRVISRARQILKELG